MYYLLREPSVAPVNIIQNNPTKAFHGTVIVTKNGKQLGIFFDNEAFEDLLEDLEAQSPAFKKSTKESLESGFVSLEEAFKHLK